MKIKRDLLIFAISAGVFGACSVAMLTAHDAQSVHPFVTYTFLGVYGLSALVAPVYFVRAVSDDSYLLLRKLISRWTG